MQVGKQETEGVPNRSEIHRLAGWRRLLAWLAGQFMLVWGLSLRVRIDRESVDLLASDVPAVVVLWHNRLFAAPMLRRRFFRKKGMVALVSASRDGAWLESVLQQVKIETARGSSSRRTLAAAREVLHAIRAGNDVAITPDGPRGPVYQVKEGAGVIARLARAPVVLLSVDFPRARRLESWDRFFIPMPFSEVVICARRWKPDASNQEIKDPREAALQIEKDLLALTRIV